MPICGRPWKEDTLREFFESSAPLYILHIHNVLFPHGIAEGARGLAAGEDPRGFFPCGLSIYLSIYCMRFAFLPSLKRKTDETVDGGKEEQMFVYDPFSSEYGFVN